MNARPWQTEAGSRRRLGAGFRSSAFRRYDDLFSYTVSVPSLVPLATTIVTIQIQDDSAFELIALSGLALQSGQTAFTTGQQVGYTIQIQDGMSDRWLFNIPVSAGCILGSAQFPHILPIPRRFMPTSTVTLQITNTDSAITYSSGTISFLGRKMFTPSKDRSIMKDGQVARFNSWIGADGRTYCEDYFAYDFFFSTIAANGVALTVPLVMDAMSDFEWILATAAAFPRNTTTGNVNANPDLLNVQVLDGASDRRLLSAVTPIGNIFGSGQTPFILPQPRVFEKSSTVRLSLTNTDSVAYNSVHMVMEGRKIFEMSPW